MNSLGQYETGTYIPSDYNLQRIADALNTRPEYLLVGVDPGERVVVRLARPQTDYAPLTLGDRLKRLRHARGATLGLRLTPQVLAEQAGLVRARVHALEEDCGKAPTWEEVVALSECLEVSPSALLVGQEMDPEMFTPFTLARINALHHWLRRRREQERVIEQLPEHAIPATFGGRVRQLRLQKEARTGAPFTQRMLADEIGIGYKAISEWEGKNRMPHLESPEMGRLIQALETTMPYLVAGIPEPGQPGVLVAYEGEEASGWSRALVTHDVEQRLQLPELTSPIRWRLDIPLPELIRSLRTRHDPEAGFPCTKREISRRTGWDPSNVTRLERPAFMASLSRMEPLAQALGVRLVHLLTGVDQTIDVHQQAQYPDTAMQRYDEETLGWRIARLAEEYEERTGIRMTREKLGEALGVRGPSITFWIKDVTTPKRIYVDRMADLFGVSPEYILTGKEAPEPVEVQRADYGAAELRDAMGGAGVFDNMRALRESLSVFGGPGAASKEKLQLMRLLITQAKRKKMIHSHLVEVEREIRRGQL